MKKIQEIINYIPEEVENAHRYEVKKKFFKLYEYKIQSIIKNIVYTIIVPFQLMTLYYQTDKIVNFIKRITKRHLIMGYTCKYSIFEVESMSEKCCYHMIILEKFIMSGVRVIHLINNFFY